MITDHTVILSVTAVSTSTALQFYHNPAHSSRLRMGFSRRQNRFRTISAFSPAPVLLEISDRSNVSSQVFRHHMNKYLRSRLRVVTTWHSGIGSVQSSTGIFIGSAAGRPSSPHNSNSRSAITSAGLLLLSASTLRLIGVHPSLSSYA